MGVAMRKTTESVELDEDAREDLARWQRYVETGKAISHENVMSWLDELAIDADAQAAGATVPSPGTDE